MRINPNSLTFDLSATMGDYSYQPQTMYQKIRWIKLVFMPGAWFHPFFLLRPVPAQACRLLYSGK